STPAPSSRSTRAGRSAGPVSEPVPIPKRIFTWLSFVSGYVPGTTHARGQEFRPGSDGHGTRQQSRERPAGADGSHARRSRSAGEGLARLQRRSAALRLLLLYQRRDSCSRVVAKLPELVLTVHDVFADPVLIRHGGILGALQHVVVAVDAGVAGDVVLQPRPVRMDESGPQLLEYIVAEGGAVVAGDDVGHPGVGEPCHIDQLQPGGQGPSTHFGGGQGAGRG